MTCEVRAGESHLRIVSPDEIGLCPRRWNTLLEHAKGLCESGQLPALSIQIQRHGKTTGVHTFGSQRLSENIPVNDQTLFLIASLTKPILAMGVLLLVERGKLALSQRVHEFLPEFKAPNKRLMTIRHLLTHTSGLPDMLPDNVQLRQSQAGLDAFLAGTLSVPLTNPVGRTTLYQSMGFVLLAAIIEKITNQTCAEFLRKELFEPLGMTRTWLGLPVTMRDESNIAEIRVPEEQASGKDWNWNSRYWRELGAPWGGALATTGDISTFLAAMLGTIQFFSPATIQEATSNRLEDFPSLPEQERRTRGWGLGWRLNWKDHRSSLCELLPPTISGHWGATGTQFWMDPVSGLGWVALSSQPVADQNLPLLTLSNMAASALIDP